jgi:nucleoside phosphorylase
MASHDFDRAGHATVSIAIICMIPDTELHAIREVLKAANATEIDLTDTYAGEQYFELETRGGIPVRIVVACCDGQSNLESAITTQIVLFRHNPRYAFLCGIGGGMKTEKYKLGDVVIASEVNYRRFTKIQDDGSFGAENFNVPPSDGGRALAQRFLSVHPNSKKIQSHLNDGDLFAIHSEKILSWDLVLDHTETRNHLLSDVDRQLAVVEMEGAGFLKAVASHAKHVINRPWRTVKAGGADALIVRGISDPAADKAAMDSGSKPWRRVAARNAAQTVLLILDILKDRDFGA